MFRFYLGEVDGPVGQLFDGTDINDEDISEGSIGMSTFLTKVGFDQIRMYP